METALTRNPDEKKTHRKTRLAARAANHGATEGLGASAGMPMFLQRSPLRPGPSLVQRQAEEEEQEEETASVESTVSESIQRAADETEVEEEEEPPEAAQAKVDGGSPDIQRQEDEEEEEELQASALSPTAVSGNDNGGRNTIVAREEGGAEEGDLEESSRPTEAQAKLKVGRPDDPLEREADDVAEQAMRMPEPSNGTPFSPGGGLQRARQVEGEDDVESERPARRSPLATRTAGPERSSSHGLSRAGGTPLSDSIRRRVEPVLGADLGHARVHNDAAAHDAAKAIRAKAFTHRNHIWLGAHQSPEDRNLMAHEATHVVQQTSPPNSSGRGMRSRRGLGEHPVQGKFLMRRAPGRLQSNVDHTGNGSNLPNPLKGGLERLSGIDLSRVRVHKNSVRPSQIGALAYTRGHNIHVAPGQEKHLPHEGWHVVQQIQGQVKSTRHENGVSINDDSGLERQADEMGARAVRLTRAEGSDRSVRPFRSRSAISISNLETNASHSTEQPVQRTIRVKVRGSFVALSRSQAIQFWRAERWGDKKARRLAKSVLEDMDVSADEFYFDNLAELKTEIEKRVNTSLLTQHTQDVHKIKGQSSKSFGYPFTAGARLYGPRVNHAARKFWKPPVPDDYAWRGKNRKKNAELKKLPRSERYKVYGDPPAGSYSWSLTAQGQKDPFRAIVNLFLPQSKPRLRSLMHCDYLLATVHFRTFIKSTNRTDFKTRVGIYGPDKIKLTFDMDWKHLRADVPPYVNVLGSLQLIRPSSKKDLVIGDHVTFSNHPAYDVINKRVGNAWRLENAVLIHKDKRGRDIFLGHGSGRRTDLQMRKKLAKEYNKVARRALKLVRKAKKGSGWAERKLRDHFQVVKVGSDYTIVDPSITEKLKLIGPDEVPGLKDPKDMSKMYPVLRPKESMK